ncbi:MAG: hypothetical protein WCK34_16820 [Bacteroidota bacterium]
MKLIPDLVINESEITLQGGNVGKIAVLIYTGERDPKYVLDYAISKYVERKPHNVLIDANMDNPWMRVIISNINDMIQEPFDEDKHRM